MIEIDNFQNDGTGWVCRPCQRELTVVDTPPAKHSRMFSEGEAESKSPALSTVALAKWTDATRQFLTCPRCGITEAVEKS